MMHLNDEDYYVNFPRMMYSYIDLLNNLIYDNSGFYPPMPESELEEFYYRSYIHSKDRMISFKFDLDMEVYEPTLLRCTYYEHKGSKFINCNSLLVKMEYE